MSKYKKLPKAPVLSKILGPSFIFLGLGLGSGELIVWPYLVSNYGMGIIWAAVLGITLQFFMNMEIERYALVKGESIFVGYWRKFRLLPIWFVISTLIPWIWPGIITTSAQIFSNILGIQHHRFIGIVLLLLIGIILSTGKSLYKTVEKFQKTLIFISVPFILSLSLYFAKIYNISDIVMGLMGKGDGYLFLPIGIPLASFLAGLAYSGAGGNLNLAQSFYIKDKGYGMGKYADNIGGVFSSNKKNKYKLTGVTFANKKSEITKFYSWWKVINLEHGVIFWLTGGITIILLCLLAFNLVYGQHNILEGINFLILESKIIGSLTFNSLGIFFLIIIGLTLFGTQLTIFDATSRILSENLSLAFPKIFPANGIPQYFYFFVWLQIFSGVFILSVGFDEPLKLILLAAFLNAIAMFVHVGLTLWTNNTLLIKPVRPNRFRNFMLSFAFVFFGMFSILTIFQKLGF